MQYSNVTRSRVGLRVLLSFLLVISLIWPLGLTDARILGRRHSNGSRAGAPEGVLPNLNQAKNRRGVTPSAPPPVLSTLRSRRRPLAPREGKRVGDRLPVHSTSPSVTLLRTHSHHASRSATTRALMPPVSPPVFTDDPLVAGSTIIRAQHLTELRDAVNQARSLAGLGAATWTNAQLLGASIKAVHIVELRARLNEARIALGMQGASYTDPGLDVGHTVRAVHIQELRQSVTEALTSPIGSDGFVRIFHDKALLRQPNAEELNYWNDILRAAYQNGQGSLVLAAREFGKTVFESAEYAARNRSDHDYVYDLYKTYLMREPDQGGWDSWTAVVPLQGREYVRRGFDESSEFLNIMATLAPTGTITSAVSSLSSALVDPKNQPGNGLLARDAEWSLPLLSLPGRAGLDLGLSLSYSSQVWTRSGPYLYFDEDIGFPSPGFRLGFPTIQEKVFDAKVGKNVYLLLSSGGRRVELRQIGSSNVYEAGDSSYLQLIDNGSLLVRSTDGTQLTYGWYNHEFRCTEIKDRNGNYLTVNYNWLGDITTITDTLGRVITFNYDPNQNPISITQSWSGETHVWASFGWGTHNMQSSFSSVSVVGTSNGSLIPVLTQVGLHDGSRYNFEYTEAGLVNMIRRRTSDNVQRAYTAYDYQTTGNDCPRLSATRVWAENWTGINGVPSEVVTQYGESGDGSRQAIAPDGTIYKEFYGGTGGSPAWQRGLTTRTETWFGGDLKKWTTLAWTQDDEGLAYQKNPRVTESNIQDAGNVKRTTIDYGAYAAYGLPYLVTEHGTGGSGVLRQTQTDYNLASDYLSRRIIGLVSVQQVSDGGSWQSKTVYGYDGGAGNTSAVQHDPSYGSTTVRGNVTSIARYDVNDINNASKALTTSINYDVNGSVISTSDPSGHQTSVAYTDSFADDISRNTFAYPTTVTDAGGFSSQFKYSYDHGARTRLQTPAPAGQTQGLIQTLNYDGAARLERATTVNNNAYTRYAYGPTDVQTFSTVNNVADEAYSIQVFDGAGRVVTSATNHPGSAGGYSAQKFEYDLMGRLVSQSNPTETNANWVPTGDDLAGWNDTKQTYDWNGRPLVTTNPDTTTKTASYSGCGCAGGTVVTLTDEVGRRQKVYSDVLGRTTKSEVLNWDASVYSATTNIYNSRDQLTEVHEYAGPEGSASQVTLMTYDGYGRLKTKHVPEQTAGTATTWDYNPDDTVEKVTDARGSVSNYSYNARHLITGITYDPSAGVADTPDVSFGYDAVGNRTSMTDGTGTANYHYDQLSRMDWEERSFAGLSATAYRLSYEYNLAGQLTALAEPSQFGNTVAYVYDVAGRLNAVSGSGFAGGVSQFASGRKYRASNALKEMNYGNGLRLNNGFNSRLQISSYQVKVPGTPVGQGERARSDYEYNPDGQIAAAFDRTDERFNRGYGYDHASRLTGFTTSAAASYQTFNYDQFDNMTQRGNGSWRHYDTTTSQYLNNRNIYTLSTPSSYPSCCPPQPSYWTYNADGHVTHDHNKEYTYDAAGNKTRVFETTQVDIALTKKLWIYQDYDADGQRAKRVEQQQYNLEAYSFKTSYYLRSTVLDDNVIIELDQNGQKRESLVYAAGLILAKQKNNQVDWLHVDPQTNSARETNPAGELAARIEFDPLGNDVPLNDPQPPEMTPDYEYTGSYGNKGNPYDGPSGCSLDGQPVPCSLVSGLINVGAAAGCPDNNCRPRFNGSEWEFLHFTDENLGYGRLNLYGPPKLKKPKPQPRGRGKKNGKKRGRNPDGVGDDERSARNFDWLPGGNQTACRVMADVAEDSTIYVGDDPQTALLNFDNEFSRLYHGGPIRTIADAQKYSPGDLRQINPYYASNGSGFKEEYRDSGPEPFPIGGRNADQTHHFSAYLSMGINGRLDIYLAGQYGIRPSLTLPQPDNAGDQRLGRAAFEYGAYLRRHPNELANIRSWIRRNICTPRGRGLYGSGPQ
ncbi:MAG TPA: DUF4214 domain-containing protein [Pyrinomonadaceae bacterium]|nr:DUF4214 domain-containing protein [Pyrinomonadaceae bacterium]